MADEYFGESPELLTVSASPTPTTTVFTVSNAVNLKAGQYILVKVSGVRYRRQIATNGISDNVVTLASALPGAPDTPGEVVNSRTLITISQHQQAAVFGASDQADLGTVDVTHATDGLKYHVAEKGTYRRSAASALPADGELVRDPDAGSGQWLWETDNGNLAGAMLGGSISDSLPAALKTWDIASMSTLTGDTTTATVAGARPGDFVLVQPQTALTNGVMVSGYVSAKNTVTLRAFNCTGGTVNPSSADFRILVITPNRVPPLTAAAIQQFEDLLGGAYNATTLQTLLGDALQLTHFNILIASRRHMQALQDDSTARTAISGSILANAVMEAYDGAGW